MVFHGMVFFTYIRFLYMPTLTAHKSDNKRFIAVWFMSNIFLTINSVYHQHTYMLNYRK